MNWPCLFCEFNGDPTELKIHSATCEKHPMRAENERLKGDLAACDEMLLGYRQREEVQAKEIQRLTKDLACSEAETAACLEYLRNEMSWEYFRAEMNSCGIDPEKMTAAERNAAKLHEFLGQGNRGEKVLADIERLTRERDEVAKNYINLLKSQHGEELESKALSNQLQAAIAERDQLREQLATAKLELQREAARLEHVELHYGLSRGDIDKERASPRSDAGRVRGRHGAR